MISFVFVVHRCIIILHWICYNLFYFYLHWKLQPLEIPVATRTHSFKVCRSCGSEFTTCGPGTWSNMPKKIILVGNGWMMSSSSIVLGTSPLQHTSTLSMMNGCLSFCVPNYCVSTVPPYLSTRAILATVCIMDAQGTTLPSIHKLHMPSRHLQWGLVIPWWPLASGDEH